MATFWAYGRHSTDKQAITQEVQKQQLEHYWRLHLEPNGVAWGGFLYDSAQSASKPLTERPKGRDLWVLAQPGDHVGWSKLDRAFRSVRDGSTTMNLLQAKGVIVHSIDLHLDTSTPMGACVFHVLLAFAELERCQASTRTAEAIAVRRTSGLVYAASPPIGWKYVKGVGGKRAVPDPEERTKVEEWFRMYQGGMTLEGLYLRVFREGHRRGKRGWHVKTIRRAFSAMAEGYPFGTVKANRFVQRHGRPRNASA